jgi:hypothetical protein
MIRGEEVTRLVTHFKRRDLLLSHACQYIDFGSYLRAGGVPSRAVLEAGTLLKEKGSQQGEMFLRYAQYLRDGTIEPLR